MKKILLVLFLIGSKLLLAQPAKYSTRNAHSHNDYEQASPLLEAYNLRFGSIEGDVFLVEGSDSLWIAHTAADLKTRHLTLDALYLQPLADSVRANKGSVYKDSSRSLQLMIDIKTGAVSTLRSLMETLLRYPSLINTTSFQIVISGNRPNPEEFASYPSFILFDAVPGVQYSPAALSKIAMISAPFGQFSKWDGKGELPAADSILLAKVIDEAHAMGKPIRFWAAPDEEKAWETLVRLKVDYINTDHLDALSAFLRQ